MPTFGQATLRCNGERVHDIAMDAAFNCPSRDGSKGWGGCSFCNNVSFGPHGRRPAHVAHQMPAGRKVLSKRTGAHRHIAYFHAYTNTYAYADRLDALCSQFFGEPNVVGPAAGLVGVQPSDCYHAGGDSLGHQGKPAAGAQSHYRRIACKARRAPPRPVCSST